MDPTATTTIGSFTVGSLATLSGVAILTSVIFQFILKPIWKPSDEILTRFGPLVSVVIAEVLSILGAFAINVINVTNVINALLLGLIAGLTAIGVFKGTQSVGHIAGG